MQPQQTTVRTYRPAVQTSTVTIKASSGGTWLDTSSNMMGGDACYVEAGDRARILERNGSAFRVSVAGKCSGWTYHELLSCSPNCKAP